MFTFSLQEMQENLISSLDRQVATGTFNCGMCGLEGWAWVQGPDV